MELPAPPGNPEATVIQGDSRTGTYYVVATLQGQPTPDHTLYCSLVAGSDGDSHAVRGASADADYPITLQLVHTFNNEAASVGCSNPSGVGTGTMYVSDIKLSMSRLASVNTYSR